MTAEEIADATGTDAEVVRARTRAALAATGARPARGGLIAAALAGFCLVAGGLAIAGAFSGDEAPPAAPEAAPPDGEQEIARIELSEASGSGAQGVVAVGVGADDSPYLDLDLTDLDPALYMLWVDVTGGRGLPLPDPVAPAADGSVRQRLPLPLELAGILEAGRTLEVVATDRAAIERVSRRVARAGALSRAGDLDPSRLPRRPGRAALRGRIG